MLKNQQNYIKVRGIRGYIWFIMDAAKRSVIGYRISSERDVGACILAKPLFFILYVPVKHSDFHTTVPVT